MRACSRRPSLTAAAIAAATIGLVTAPHATSVAASTAIVDGVIANPLTGTKGDAARAIARAPRVVEGSFEVGGQEHFYLEGQVAAAVPPP